ncbi:MAG TPA: glycosyltransferase [Candidatus Binatia bacterium]|nr:glycosyltransferase [Candidatus Solibacter sp.]HUK52691.1 glycosyltransferase [Candidatus Binatia bacterium]
MSEAMSAVAVPAPPGIAEYAAVVGESEIGALRVFARQLQGRRVQMVNSTAVGGGVAEILNRLVPLLGDLGMATRWEVLKGGEQFFAVTKGFHNALHGAPYQGNADWFDIFVATNEENRRHLTFDDEFVVIHDPQPVALVNARDGARGKWVWRCHIDLSHPAQEVWEFLHPFVERYDAAVFSSPAFSQRLGIPQYLVYPTIDPLSDKNRELEPEFVHAVLERFGIDPQRPILTQVSRFDRLKDPLGVIQAYKMVRKHIDCQLVLAGGGASDDPEGETVLNEVNAAAQGDPDIHILNLPPWSHLEINALQRASTVVIQKSLREGFGLTVAEALWKRKPVVASAVGGIPTQVIHKLTGMLVHSIEGTAYQIRFLLSNPSIARKLGENGREHVKENLLITHNLKRYLMLLLALQGRK